MALLYITGNLRDRFMQAAVLLRMLDPVRGESSAHGLDQNEHDIDSSRPHLLKRKFLDSFALVCATRRDGDTVSAACLEEGRPEGTVIRVSSNAGISPTTLGGLRALVAMLSCIASRATSPFCTESDILLSIIRLDICKIRKYLKKLRMYKKVFEMSISALEGRLLSSEPTLSAVQDFLAWTREVSSIFEISDDPEPETLLDHIQRAQIARKNYLEFLEAANPVSGQPLQAWVLLLFKLGRYGIASRAFVTLALELPELFCPMVVEPVTTTPKTSYVVSKNISPLTAVLRRVADSDLANEYIARLSAIWNTADAEVDFRNACSMNLVVHAELQLVNFYDHNRECKPYFRFIGVSKKSCYLCYLFLASHPGSFCVSSCHQKLYLPWITPPSLNVKVYKQCKAITSNMSKKLEAAVRQHLESRLYTARRPLPLDSTAGVSLSGLTNPLQAGTTTPPISDEEILSAANDELSPEDGVPIGTEILALESAFIDNIEIAQSRRQERPYEGPSPFSAMVFHVRRIGSVNQQDIIAVVDIIDERTRLPSWKKFVGIMQIHDDCRLAFQEDYECLLINENIRVSSERQFQASLQYLLNLNILSVSALVQACE